MKDCKNCKHYKRSERIGIKVCEFDLLHESYCEKDKEDFAIEELEKIKEEVEEKEFNLDCSSISNVALKTAYIEVTKLLDKHIAELKGGAE